MKSVHRKDSLTGESVSDTQNDTQKDTNIRIGGELET